MLRLYFFTIFVLQYITLVFTIVKQFSQAPPVQKHVPKTYHSISFTHKRK